MNYNRQLEAVIVRLERAGGNVSEAIERTPTGPLREQLTTVNIMLADTRRAFVRLSNGEDIEVVKKDLMEQMLKGAKGG